MRAFGSFFRRTGTKVPLRLKNGDTFAAAASARGITAREAEIISLLLEGKDNRRITEALFISDHTVKNHIHNIYRKLGVQNRIQLVRCFQAALEGPGSAADASTPPPPGTSGAGKMTRRIAVPVALTFLVGAAGLIAWKPWEHWPRPAVHSPLPALAVLDFDNLSGDADLDKWVTGFPMLLTTDLLQSKRLRTFGSDEVYEALKEVELKAGSGLSRRELQSLAHELKADYILSGNLMKAGGSIVITAFLQDARSGGNLRTERIECPDEQGLLREADALARLVRSGLDTRPGGPEEDIDLDVEDLTTTYALAFRYYAEALRYHRTGDYGQSLLMLRKAVELDPEFAMAYRLMSVDARNLGYYAQEADFMRTAFDLSARLPEDSRERHLIRGDYYSHSESTYRLSIEAFKLILDEHPGDVIANNNLAMLYYDLEDYEAAARYASMPIRQGTANPFPYHTKAAALKALGRSGEAVRLLESYLEKHPANRLVYETLAQVLIDGHDMAAAMSALDRAAAVFPEPSWAEHRGTVLFHTQGEAAAEEEFRRLLLMEEAPWRLRGYERLGNVALAGGRFREAAALFERGVALAETAGQASWEALLRRLHARALLGSGDTSAALAEARRAAEAARAEGRGYGIAAAILFQAQVLVESGDTEAAAALAEQSQALAAPGAAPRLIRANDFFQGYLALARGRQAEAIKLMDEAAALIVRRDGADFSTVLYDYHLASAREKAGDLAGAARLLRKIVEGPGDALSFEGYFAKAVIDLARLDDRRGNQAAAAEGYRRFFELWKNADQGRPEIAETGARLAALSGPAVPAR
jgi:DNA-binding CsgD family transcriptional regulator/tetratricopeptide (TPR) repeat protein